MNKHNPRVPIFNGPTPDGRRWYEIRNEAKDKPAEVLIYDTIGKETDWWSGETTGVGAEDFINEVKALGDTRDLVIGINSRGGNIWDGLAIYNFLSRHKGNVTTRVDGLAGSIASVIALAGKEVQMPETAQFMIHDPSTIAVGGIEDMQKAIQALHSGKQTIIAAYMKKTRRSEAEISEKMTSETWFTGREAKAFGFVDTLTSQTPIFNSIDLSCFKRVPEALRKITDKTAVQTAGKHQQQENTMDRTKIIALLKKHGATVDDKATIEQLEAQLETLLTAKAKDTPTPPAADSNIIDLRNELKAIREERDRERKARIEGEVNACVEECRIPANDKDFWVGQAMKDEAVLAKIKAMPKAPAGVEVKDTIECKSEALADVVKHIGALALENSASKIAFIRKNQTRIVDAWHQPAITKAAYKIRNEGTNTIDTTLKQDVILDQALLAFSRRLTALSLFSTKYENVPLKGTNKIQVPYIALESAASTAWNAANGYLGGDTATDNKEIAIDQRYYQAIRWTAEEFARQPYLLLADHAKIKGDKLAYDAWLAILGVVTAANFATAAYTGPAAAFSSNNGIDLGTAADVAEWPEPGRVLFLNSAFDNVLKKDNAVKLALNIGGTEVLRQGKLPDLFGFTYASNTKVPANGENLAGFIAWKSAIAIGNAPIAPLEDEIRAGLLYSTMTDPDTGLTLEMKRFGQPQMSRAFWTLEFNYGFAALEAAALQRIATA